MDGCDIVLGASSLFQVIAALKVIAGMIGFVAVAIVFHALAPRHGLRGPRGYDGAMGPQGYPGPPGLMGAPGRDR